MDLKSITWLENFLLNFKNTVIVVSHDRHFLNKVCTHIADIDYSRIQLYVGNYDFWYEYSQMQIQQAKDQNKKAEAKKKELEEFIARFSANASKAKQATSRKKLLDNLEMVDIKPSLRRYPFIGFKPGREVGNIVLNVEGLTKVVDGEKLINNVSFSIQPNEKVAFVGDDKATEAFFKIIMGEDEDYEGEFKWGVTTSQSYFPKDNSKYFNDCELSLVDWLRQFTDGTVYEQDLRGWLGRVLFSGEEALKKANVLSGGEKVRCMLAKMMMEDANVLVTMGDGSVKFVEQNLLNTDLTLNLSQNLFWTGGSFFLETSAQRMDLFSEHKYSWQTSPIMIGYRQSLFGYNSLKWDRRIEPVRYQEAKKSYVETLELVSANAIHKFFALATAQSDYDIASFNSTGMLPYRSYK